MPLSATGNSKELSESLTRMAGLRLSEETLDAILDMIASLARSAIEPADHVSVTLVRDGNVITAARSDELVTEIDQGQYDSKEGPCISAMQDRLLVDSPSLKEESRWPAFTTVAIDKGVGSVRSVPLSIDDHSLGALNLYSNSPHSFTETAQVVDVFARHASVVLANAEAYASAEQLNEQLTEALRSREIIGQAKGILMEREGCDGDDAFDMLRRISQNSNTKLRDIAQGIVNSVDTKDQREGSRVPSGSDG
jgi:GAF domain-containing protein